jgi:hypothetical protein
MYARRRCRENLQNEHASYLGLLRQVQRHDHKSSSRTSITFLGVAFFGLCEARHLLTGSGEATGLTPESKNLTGIWW